MSKTRIAVVSTDGLNVNDHFGKAQRFLIYDIDEDTTWVENRPTEMLSVGDPNHPFDADKFNRITALIADCRQLYVTQIGPGPADRLKALGIETVLYSGPISQIAT